MKECLLELHITLGTFSLNCSLAFQAMGYLASLIGGSVWATSQMTPRNLNQDQRLADVMSIVLKETSSHEDTDK